MATPTLSTDPLKLLTQYVDLQNAKIDYSTGGSGDMISKALSLYNALGNKPIYRTTEEDGRIDKSATKIAAEKFYRNLINDPSQIQEAITKLNLNSPEFSKDWNDFYTKANDYFHQGDVETRPAGTFEANQKLNKISTSSESNNIPIFSDTNSKTKTPFTTKIASTLTQGSSGDGVKEIQRWLADTQGAKNADGTPLKVDGLYGPQTVLAIKQWQSQNGLTPDGIFGPKSLAAYQKVATTGATNANTSTGTGTSSTGTGAGGTSGSSTTTPTFNTGDTGQDELLQTLQDWIKTQQDAGLKINEALNFDQKTLDKFLETAKKQVHPYYQSQIDTIKQDVLRAAPQILQNYERDIEGAQSDFTNTLGKAREGYADAGLAFSGQRGQGELGLQSAQNRDLASLSEGYGNKLYELGRGAEEKIGSSNAGYNLGALRNYSANLGGSSGGFTLGGTSTPYQSGGIGTGSLEYDRESDTEARRQALLRSASESVVAGRDYTDLFN